ncbi:putative ferric-chelate reductase 1 isoform X2 [Melanotaenia boesemani]|uniref:putative ferric-chelate reductase 1 isoform X2 n=1 Tax=Melanotaenia boesemani TaxID=1250792 RepID=UPI001C0554E9|nr:putative ferric-chelate reductase 1 isoform X2 [Melanotaenia boesemani]
MAMEIFPLLLVCFVPMAWCYKTGLVTASCVNMQPNHPGNPQTGPSPYTVTTDPSSFIPGQAVKVLLQAPASKPFTGFLLQARKPGSNSPVGSFTATTGTQLLNCGSPSTAVSHTSDSAKTQIQVTWTSTPSVNVDAVQFHATFVQSYSTYWVDVTTPVLKSTNSSSGSGSIPQASSISSADCGVTKVCFSKPSSCDPSADFTCYFMSATMLSPGGPAVRYEMTGPSNGYISFGFSDDQKMGNDDIYICGMSNNGSVMVQHAYSTGETAPLPLALGNVSDIKTSIQNNVISCSFTSMNSISTQRSSYLNKTYYLLFAYGPSSNGNIQFHTGTFASTNKMDITTPSVASHDDFSSIMRAHGALMLIAWMTTGSLGMLVARYLKRAGKGFKLCGKDFWFVVHVAVMSVTLAATAIAFILAFAHAQDWSGGAHPVLGCLVTILSLFQPIMAMLRCGPQHPMRFVFNWSHSLNALVIKALAVAAIFTGLERVDSTTDVWLMKVMGGFVGWEIVFYILFDFHLKWKIQKNRSDFWGIQGGETRKLK